MKMSFQENPPQGTCLRAVTIPPTGGDTLFADQHKAPMDAMTVNLLERLEGETAIHSARLPYSPGGAYGTSDQEADRSMDIRSSSEAFKEQVHAIIRLHPETGRPGILILWLYRYPGNG